MIDEHAFIATIRSHPFEWGPRLVYADWLEEQGESRRADLLRLLNQVYTSRSSKQPLFRQINELSRNGPLHVEPFFLNSVGVLMRRVEAGTFWPGGGDGVLGTHQVAIPHDYFIGVFPIMQGEWQAVMGNNPSDFSRTGGGRSRVKAVAEADLARFPVESVSWNEVQQFLDKLNHLEPNREWEYRLPTEVEWEFACRAAASSRQECAFRFYFTTPTNDLSSNDANFDGHHPAGRATPGRKLRRTTRVGAYLPNALGLFDMHGNVWEWTNTAAGSRQIIRGGSWHNYGHHCSAANQHTYTPEFRTNVLGFRLARVRVERPAA